MRNGQWINNEMHNNIYKNTIKSITNSPTRHQQKWEDWLNATIVTKYILNYVKPEWKNKWNIGKVQFSV